MTDLNCSACEELRQTAPDFVVNGLSDDACTSLSNGTGLNPSNENDNCTDLDNINDCLIGNMATEVEAYDVCDWKEFMKNFIPNLWTTHKALICAICGVWKHIRKLWCTIDHITEGASFTFGENTEGVESKIVPGKGVDFSIRSADDQHGADIAITYIGGAFGVIHGSLSTFTENFRDANNVLKDGNSVWDFEASNYTLPNGGELLYEIRIKKSEYPQIKSIHNGHAWNNGGGQKFFQCLVRVFDGDNIPAGSSAVYAFGQHGWCDKDGTPSSSGYSKGHVCPQGWIYVQVRMMYVGKLSVGQREDGAGYMRNGSVFSPRGNIGMRMNIDALDC